MPFLAIENRLFKRGDRVKFKSTNTIFPDLIGTVFSPYGNHHFIVDFESHDNGQSHIFDDNDIDIFRLHRVHEDMIERWDG